jgi:hypothetical protein
MSPQGMLSDVMEMAKTFDQRWERCKEPHEKKEFIQLFVHQVNVNRESARMYADCWLHKIPLAVINKPAGLPFEMPGHLHKGLLRGRALRESNRGPGPWNPVISFHLTITGNRWPFGWPILTELSWPDNYPYPKTGIAGGQPSLSEASVQ